MDPNDSSDDSGETNFDLVDATFPELAFNNNEEETQLSSVLIANDEEEEEENNNATPEIEETRSEVGEEIPTTSKSTLNSKVSTPGHNEQNFIEGACRKLKHTQFETCIFTNYKGLIIDPTNPQIDVLNLSVILQNSYYNKTTNSISFYNAKTGVSMTVGADGTAVVSGSSSIQNMMQGFANLIYALNNFAKIKFTFFEPCCLSLTAILKSKHHFTKSSTIEHAGMTFLIGKKNPDYIVIQYVYEPEKSSKMLSFEEVHTSLSEFISSKVENVTFNTLEFKSNDISLVGMEMQ